ncbi:MAG: glutathione peroxidase [Clostridiales bacterium]|jgi:glutathione peroxidase|nr:glutathione peroxidase [Clostridiales bacterium]MDR2749660.1 glutathione peroxidase [Clostridiales bacterium]
MPIYDFTVKGADGKDVSLSAYKGKVLLVVNTATACGFTPQYKGLQELYDKLKGRGVEILDFPCNQFGHQAPGSDEEIGSFCEMKYHTTFPRFKKIDVNGESADPLYKWLKSKKGGVFGDNIKWNFSKFIIDKNGEVAGRFPSTTTPAALESELEKLL